MLTPQRAVAGSVPSCPTQAWFAWGDTKCPGMLSPFDFCTSLGCPVREGDNMLEMRSPGFTAQDTLYRADECYHMAGAVGSSLENIGGVGRLSFC